MYDFTHVGEWNSLEDFVIGKDDNDWFLYNNVTNKYCVRFDTKEEAFDYFRSLTGTEYKYKEGLG